MTDRDDSAPPDLRVQLAALSRERDPGAAFEERVVRSLFASGDIGPESAVPRLTVRPWRRAWIVSAAAVVVVAITVSWWVARPPAPRGDLYVMLLYNESTYRAPEPGHMPERVAEYGRWADSLEAAGRLDREGRLAGPGPLTGMFIVRARDEAEAARIAATCPHLKYGGTIQTRRLIE
jgi:hypothetical protein